MNEQNEERFKKLRWYNLIMGFFHLAQGVLMIVLSNDFKLPVTTSYLSFDVVNKTIDTVTFVKAERGSRKRQSPCIFFIFL